MLCVRLLAWTTIISLSEAHIVLGGFPDFYVSEGGKTTGRVLEYRKDDLQYSFSRRRLPTPTHSTGIGSLEFVSSDEFYLCSGEDSILIRRSRVGEEVFYLSQNVIKQVRSDIAEQIWWSEQATEPQETDMYWGSLWRWDKTKRQAERMYDIKKSQVEGKWDGAFDICNDGVLLVTHSEKSLFYNISISDRYEKVLETSLQVRTFRWDNKGQIWCMDHRGRIIHLPAAKFPERFEVALGSRGLFTDFDFQVPR